MNSEERKGYYGIYSGSDSSSDYQYGAQKREYDDARWKEIHTTPKVDLSSVFTPATTSQTPFYGSLYKYKLKYKLKRKPKTERGFSERKALALFGVITFGVPFLILYELDIKHGPSSTKSAEQPSAYQNVTVSAPHHVQQPKKPSNIKKPRKKTKTTSRLPSGITERKASDGQAALAAHARRPDGGSFYVSRAWRPQCRV